MKQSFEEAGMVGKEFFDTGMQSLAALSSSMQTITAESAEFSKKSFETGSAALEQMVSAKSPDKAMEIQANFAKSAYEGFVAQATRMSEIYAEMAKDVYKPFESVVAKAK